MSLPLPDPLPKDFDGVRRNDEALAGLVPVTAQNIANDAIGSAQIAADAVGLDERAAVPHARVRATSHSNILAGANTNITFTTEVFDNDNMVDIAGAPTRITMTTAGLYLVQGNVLWGINNTNNARIAWLSHNGTTTIAIEHEQAEEDQVGQSMSTLYRFAAGDFINLAVHAVSTTALDCTLAAAPVLTACYLSK